MFHRAKIYSIWKMFYFVSKFTHKTREEWALRQRTREYLVLVKKSEIWLVSGSFSHVMGGF